MAQGRRRHCRTTAIRDARRKRAEEVQANRTTVTDEQQLELIGRRRGESARERARLEERLSRKPLKPAIAADDVDVQPTKKKTRRGGRSTGKKELAEPQSK